MYEQARWRVFPFVFSPPCCSPSVQQSPQEPFTSFAIHLSHLPTTPTLRPNSCKNGPPHLPSVVRRSHSPSSSTCSGPSHPRSSLLMGQHALRPKSPTGFCPHTPLSLSCSSITRIVVTTIQCHSFPPFALSTVAINIHRLVPSKSSQHDLFFSPHAVRELI